MNTQSTKLKSFRQFLIEPPAPSWYSDHSSPILDRRTYLHIKRLVDFTVALLALPVAIPVIAVFGILIKIESPGPILFRQKRTGKGGRRFTLFKLRSMVNDAEKLKGEYRHLNRMSGPDFKIAEDPRITRVGRIIRKYSIDELPQFFNVLRGDLSLVGPRPTSFPAETYSLWQTARLEIQPGLTGLWQISGRGEVDFDERLRLDIAYIQNQSLMLDLMILLRTPFALLRARGAF